MSITIVFKAFLFVLTIISLSCGISMTTFLVLVKHKKGNQKKNEAWLHGIMKFFWIFMGFMAVMGIIIGLLAF